MKSVKRSVAVLLALLVAFSSFAMLASAEALYNWELDTQFYRMQRNADGYIVDKDGNVIADADDVLNEGAEPVWIPADGRAKKGEAVKARVFMTTDFPLGPSQFFFFFPTAFLTHDTSKYTNATTSTYTLLTNSDTNNKVGKNGFGGVLTTSTEVEGMFDEMVWEGYLDESDIEGKGWVWAGINTASGGSITLDGKDWLFEFNFIVNKDASDAGQFYLSTECISDYDNWMAATVIAAGLDGEGGDFADYEASCDVDTGTFAYVLNDTDEDSSLKYTTATLTFDANGGTFKDGSAEKSETADIQPMKAATLPEDPSIPGGEFLGWVKADVENPTEDDVLDAANIKYGYYDVAYKALYRLENSAKIIINYTDAVTGEAKTVEKLVASKTGYTVKLVETAPAEEDKEPNTTYVTFAELTAVEHYAFDAANASNEFSVEVAEDGTATMDVYYAPVNYTATFEPDNGEAATTETKAYWTEITAPAAPAKSGMKFTNWLGNDGSTLAAGAKFNLAGDVTYTAQYESAETTVAVKVKYNDLANGGAEKIVDVKTVTAIVGNTVALVEEAGTDENTAYVLISELPEIAHYEYDAANTTTTVTAAEGGVAELIVAYKPVKYTATFTGAEAFENVDYFTEITAPAGPAADGKTFTGWKLEGTETVIAAGDKFNIDANVTYTPVYEDIYYNTTVTFNGEEGVDYPEDAVVPTVASGKMGDEIVLADPEAVTGWEFLGWDTPVGAVEKDGKYYYGTSDVTVTGNWAHTEYTITFWLDGAQTIYYDSYNYFYGDVVEFPDAPPADLMPAGQKFVEWDSDIITMPAENVDVIAASEDIIYTVSVKTLPDEDPYTFDAIYGDIITSDDLAEFEEQEGYTFDGWKINGKDMTAPFEYKVVGNTSIVAKLTVNTWDLYFWADADDAEPIAKFEDIEYGAAIHTYTPVAPTKEGYKFRFWDMEPTTMEDSDMHFTAVWKTEEYTVIWDNDGTIVEQQQAVKYGSSLEIPEVTKTGYTFKGWAGLAADATTMPDVGDDGATVTYTAVWEANTYDAVFYLDDEKTEVYETVPTAFDADIVAPEDPSKSGYDFAGWAPAVGKMDDVNGKEFVATWTAKGDTPYTVNVYTMGTDGEYVLEPKPFTAATDSTATYTPEIAEGFSLNANSVTSGTVTADGNLVLNIWIDRNTYTLTTVVDGVTETKDYLFGAAVAVTTPVKEGHSFAWDAAVPVTMPAKNVTLNGTFTVNTYDVIYVVDGVEYERTEDVAFGTEVTAIEAPTKEGYTFSGWDKTAFTMPDEDVTVSGTFTVNTHDVIYVVDGDEYNRTADVAFGTTVTPIAAPTKEGYTFSGWDKAEAFAMPDEDVVISGTFTVNTYDVIYVIDGVEYERTEDVAFGTEVTAIEAPTKEGYTFSGWDKTAFTMPDEDVTVSGTFTVNTHNVIYVVDGSEYEKNEVAFGTEVTVIDALTKEGYTFSGWDKTGTFTMPDEDVTISGSWTVNTHDVIYMVDGVEYARVEDVAFGTPVTVLDDLVEAGKDFSGWDKTDFTMPDEDVVINGSWTINNFTVTFYTDKDKSATHYTYTGAYGAEYNIPLDPEMEGHKFLGWANVADDVDAGLPEAGTIANVPLGGVEYYATWETLSYKLVYQAGTDAQFADGATQKTYDVAYGTAQAEWPVPTEELTRPGYTFGGWDMSKAPATMGATPVRIAAIWNAIDYTVTWIDGDAQIVNDYIYGEEILAPEEPVKEGWTFTGWLEADGETIFSEGDVMGEKSLVYTAQWEGNDGIEYTVYKYFEKLDKSGWEDAQSEVLTGKAGEYAEVDTAAAAVKGFTIDTDISVLKKEIAGNGTTVLEVYYRRNTVNVTVKDPDGETYKDEDYLFGATIELEDPEKEGFTFVEWQDAEGNKVTFPMTAPADDVVIKPIWSTNTYTITFEDDNGDIIEAAKEVEFGSAIVAPADPEKDGYNFAYWVDKETGAVMPATMPAKNATYVAYYTAGDDTTYYIEVYTMDVNGEYTMTAQTVATGTTGERIAVNPGELNGYTYDDSLSVLTGVITADGKAALKIYYARDLYTVTFKSGDGVFADDATVVGPTSVFYGAAIPVPAEPTREGYDFAGWDAEVPAGMPAENLTFTATWTEAEYTITYIENDKKTVKTYKFGEAVEKRADPEVAGMTFTGWDTEIPETMPAEDLIIIAVFEISVYEVKYIADGVVFQQYAVAHGDEIPVPTEKPTKKFYKFVGWTEIPETMPAQNIEINAIFERVDVKLIPMAGSTTVIDDETMAIYGLQLYATEEILRESYLDVEGDGYFTVTPSKKTMCGTGTVVELYDNVTGELLETYTIVIFGDLNGDSNINNSDYSIAQAEVDWFTAWSDPTSDEYNVYKTMAADFDKDGMIGRNEAASINREVLGAISIDQTSGNVIAVV